ncbi:DUF3263 domain-containing protein [Brevibacterium casei]|uniref:DUF3263 domain-containing protein n=1 Tax=Brevibacterium casei TaxID=33889 RepID=UPI00223A78EC|nr:DUF3263 domain-containing protein [Brevibacterium casei]MCT1446159.1 DUF3263 domain-containing protein [Brevibacterium casei]
MDDLERAVLDLEREHPRYNGAKDDAIRRRLNMSATSYFQILNQLLDDPAALESDPVLLNRLRRVRNQNR